MAEPRHSCTGRTLPAPRRACRRAQAAKGSLAIPFSTEDFLATVEQELARLRSSRTAAGAAPPPGGDRAAADPFAADPSLVAPPEVELDMYWVVPGGAAGLPQPAVPAFSAWAAEAPEAPPGIPPPPKRGSPAAPAAAGRDGLTALAVWRATLRDRGNHVRARMRARRVRLRRRLGVRYVRLRRRLQSHGNSRAPGLLAPAADARAMDHLALVMGASLTGGLTAGLTLALVVGDPFATAQGRDTGAEPVPVRSELPVADALQVSPLVRSPDRRRRTAVLAMDREVRDGVARQAAPLAATGRRAVRVALPGDARLFERAALLLRLGDIAGARLLLEHLASRGSVQSAFALAQTYDPDHFKSFRAEGLKPDPSLAIHWYAFAAHYGLAEAGDRLKTLAALEP